MVSIATFVCFLLLSTLNYSVYQLYLVYNDNGNVNERKFFFSLMSKILIFKFLGEMRRANLLKIPIKVRVEFNKWMGTQEGKKLL